MKLQRTTLILLGTAILLGSFVYLHEIQGAPQKEAAKTTKQPIFSFKEDQIQFVSINLNEKTLEFERVTGQQTNWRMKTPQNALASNASVAFLLNFEGKSDRSFPVQAKQLQEYGLDKPSTTVTVKLKNQQTHRLILGKPDFNRSFLYAQADPSSQMPQQKVLLVPIDFQYAVNRPMSEWQFKQETPPSPKPSPSSGSSTPSPVPNTSKPSPTPDNSKPSPTPRSSTPSPVPNTPKPSPTPESSKPSPTPENSKPSPTPRSSTPSPVPNTSKPSPTPRSSTPSPASNTSKPSPTSNSSQPSPTPETSKSSPAADR
jgi:hypothetical protein